MSGALQTLQLAVWVVNTLAGVLLLLLVVGRRNDRIIPAFTLYLLTNTALNVWAFLTYKEWGYLSGRYWWFAWGMQIVAISARALAVGEYCRRLLARYRGIWNLAWRILLMCAGGLLIYSCVAAKYQWELGLIRAQRGLELAIAAVIVGALVFVRYYRVEASTADLCIGAGFCSYSCFSVLNNTIFERYLDRYATQWTTVQMLMYSVSLLLWCWALRRKLPEKAREVELLPEGVYRALTPQINIRLEALNESLKRLWHPEVKEP